jgi:hypothetical protein
MDTLPTLAVSPASETELHLGAKVLNEYVGSWPIASSLSGVFPPFLGRPEDDQTTIDELARRIGTCRPEHAKLLSRMTVQIALGTALKMGVMLGLIIGEHRRKKLT